MTLKKLSLLGATAALSATFSTPLWAAMGNTASTYGLFPTDVGTAQALSLFNSQTSAVYYNPAYLTKDSRGELTVGLLHGEQELRASSQGNPNGGQAAVVRDGDVLNDTDSQQVLIAMKTDLTDITKFEHPIYFAFMAGVEKFGEEMLAFKSETSTEGQFFSYDRQPLFLNLGGGMELVNGVSVGASAHVSLKADATMVATTDLAGNTQYEKLDVSAKPVIRPVLGVTMEWSKIFCGHDDCGIWDGLETSFAFRGHTQAETSVNATVTIPNTVLDPGITLLVSTLDSYQPDIWSAGLQYRFSDNLRVAASAELQTWKDLEDKLDGDTIKDQANVELQDIVVPRIGAEWQVHKNIILSGGLAYQETPLESIQTPDVNYLDSDKTIVGVGAAWIIHNPPILAYPMRLDFGYQYQMLEEKDFDLTTTRPGVTNPYERVTADGDVHVFSGSLTLKF